MPLSISQIDAFTDKAFGGNPAAVCVLPVVRDAVWMQSVAAEMNLPETSFLVRQADGYNLRWFTPAVEVDLCGHATLAAAHALWEEGHLKPEEQARFYTRSGLLTAQRNGLWIELDFPSTPDEPAPAPEGLIEGLGAAPKYTGKSAFDYIVELDSEQTVRKLKPNFSLLANLPVRGVIVTSEAENYDFVSRFFAPAVGIPEDSVTGSAHCCLGPFWSKRLGKTEFIAHQASKRGGLLHVRVEGDRVHLGGQAVTVLRGNLLA